MVNLLLYSKLYMGKFPLVQLPRRLVPLGPLTHYCTTFSNSSVGFLWVASSFLTTQTGSATSSLLYSSVPMLHLASPGVGGLLPAGTKFMESYCGVGEGRHTIVFWVVPSTNCPQPLIHAQLSKLSTSESIRTKVVSTDDCLSQKWPLPHPSYTTYNQSFRCPVV